MASRRKSSEPPRILRVGILLGDTFIEERLIRDRKPVTVGQSTKNAFSLPVEGMPKSWTLFDLVAGNYVLKISEGMDGRVAVDGRPRSLDSLKGKEARHTDDCWTLPLTDRSRGKIELGDMKLLFQFVAAPPLQPRPRLPASIRGSFTDRVDPRLALILAISLMVHFSIALWAFQHDQTKERHAQKRLKEFRMDRFKERTITMPDQPAATAKTAEKGAAGDDDKGDDKPKRTASKDTGSDGPEGPPTDATLDRMVRQTAIVDVLGGDQGADGRYSTSDDMDQGADLDKGMSELKRSGTAVAAFGAGDRQSRGPASGEIGDDQSGGKITGPEGGGTTGPKEEQKITSRASISGIDDESFGTLDPDLVARKIRTRYRSGLQKCHERLLKINPKAGGRVQLSFTVGPTGRVTRAQARGFDPSLDKCIEQQRRRWRFGTPKDEDGKPTQARFSMPVLLKAGT